MTRRLFVVCVLSACLVGCQSQKEASDADAVYNAQVAHALQHKQENDSKRRTTIAFESGATAQTCGEYLRLVGGSALKEGVNNQQAKGDYLLCEVLALVGNRKLGPARMDIAFGQSLATRLDIRSFSSSLFQMLDEKKYTLSHIDVKAVKAESTSVTYETRDWYYRLELVATLDVNNNGKTDWVLWLADEAKSGNYRQYQTLIVLDVSDSGTMSAVPYAVTMNAKTK